MRDLKWRAESGGKAASKWMTAVSDKKLKSARLNNRLCWLDAWVTTGHKLLGSPSS